ncbi:uncharacterized protein LOC142349748 [Convolutriloba macropyga]|uniref:uncharacterized protein LOC142349748 n=1 Tax=Convolutriloba macropyga TaxID=536237 RepID=UPI003F527400
MFTNCFLRNKSFVLSLAVFLDVVLEPCCGTHDDESYYGNHYDNWQSLIFIFPTPINVFGVRCQRYSKYACLFKYEYFTPQSERENRRQDSRTFEALIRHEYFKYNWFPLTHFRRTCCSFQRNIYKTYGQEMGVSPHGYYMRITDFTNGIKLLNWVYAEYQEHLCSNLIVSVGFGQGDIILAGDVRSGYSFILPVFWASDFFIVPDGRFRSFIRFSWFKEQFLCHEQPWMCNLEGDILSDSEASDQDGEEDDINENEDDFYARRRYTILFSNITDANLASDFGFEFQKFNWSNKNNTNMIN